MFHQPTKEEKQTVIETIESFPSQLMPTSTLFRVLEEKESFGRGHIAFCLNDLEVEDKVWSILIPEDNDEGLSPGEFVYIPSDDIDSVNEL